MHRYPGRISKTRKKMGMKDYATKCPAATQARHSRRDLAEISPRSRRDHAEIRPGMAAYTFVMTEITPRYGRG